MNKEDQFLEMSTLVDPSLDIATGLINKIGNIYKYNSDLNLFFVNFDAEECFAAFPPEALLILRNLENIMADAMHDFDFISYYDYEAIMEVVSCINCKSPAMLNQAIKLSQKSPAVMPYTMHSIQRELDLQRNYYFGR